MPESSSVTVTPNLPVWAVYGIAFGLAFGWLGAGVAIAVCKTIEVGIALWVRYESMHGQR